MRDLEEKNVHAIPSKIERNIRTMYCIPTSEKYASDSDQSSYIYCKIDYAL